MKKINTIAAMVIALIFITGVSSCNKQLDFFLTIDDEVLCLPEENIVLSTGHIKSFEFPLSKVRSEFDKQGITYEENRIDQISISSFKVKFESSTGGKTDLSDLSGAQVYVKKVGEAGLGKQVAEVNIPQSNIAEINMNVTGESLKPYLNEEKIIFTVTIYQHTGGNKQVCVKLTEGKISIKAKK